MTSLELPRSSEEALAFFRGIDMGDIYGKPRPNPKTIPITGDIYFRWGHLSAEEREAELRDFAEEFGIEDIGSYGGGGTDYSVDETSETRKLAWWIPSYAERPALLALAGALTEAGKPPTILDGKAGIRLL